MATKQPPSRQPSEFDPYPPKPSGPLPYEAPERSDHYNAAMALSRQAFDLAESL